MKAKFPAIAIATLLATALAACSPGAGQPDVETTVVATPTEPTGVVNLITHDSWAISPEVQQQFEAESGLRLQVLPVGDAGTLANQIVLTKDNPLGDVVFGIDNTFASRVEDAGVIDGGLHAVTQGDVCLNVDSDWFTEHGIPEPNTLDDIVRPEYAGLTVVLNPASSSPGLAFLLATIGAFGESGTFDPASTADPLANYDAGWQEYWRALRANDVAVADSWSDGYQAQFSGAGEDGTRPIVVSYATSPAFTVSGDHSTTRALLNTCFRQTEYAGVLQGATNPVAGQKLVDFLTGPTFQADVPGQMYMYPVDSAVELPSDWARFAPQAEHPFEVAPSEIAANRDAWIDEWTRIVVE